MEIKLNRSNLEVFLEEVENEIVKIGEYLKIEKEKQDISLPEFQKLLNQQISQELKDEISKISESVQDNLQKLTDFLTKLEELKQMLLEAEVRKAKSLEMFDLLNEITDEMNKFLEDKNTVIENMLKTSVKLEKLSMNLISELNQKLTDTQEELKEEQKKQEKAKVELVETVGKILEKEEQPQADVEKGETKEEKSEEKIADKEIENKKIEETEVEQKEEQEIKDNKLLIISEKEQKVYLPYTYKELENKLKVSYKYSSMQDLINNEYVLDLEKFKNPVSARFRESYNLIKNKEKGSIVDALQLSFELMFNYKLNPAIIAACKTEDELDIYLDCLAENELDSFSIFEAKYDIAPNISVEQPHRRRNVE